MRYFAEKTGKVESDRSKVLTCFAERVSATELKAISVFLDTT